jgi:hypothetical protein
LRGEFEDFQFFKIWFAVSGDTLANVMQFDVIKGVRRGAFVEHAKATPMEN